MSQRALILQPPPTALFSRCSACCMLRTPYTKAGHCAAAGALNLDGSMLEGRVMINLDEERLGEVCVGTSGQQSRAAGAYGYCQDSVLLRRWPQSWTVFVE